MLTRTEELCLEALCNLIEAGALLTDFELNLYNRLYAKSQGTLAGRQASHA